MGSILFLLIFFVVSICIVGLVLLQEGKGGGLTGMSTGMDGVMGARNPLRRWTAYFFVVFVVMCLVINMYFHNRDDASLPAGLEMNVPAGIDDAVSETIPEGSLRPGDEAGAAVPPTEIPAPAPADNAVAGTAAPATLPVPPAASAPAADTKEAPPAGE